MTLSAAIQGGPVTVTRGFLNTLTPGVATLSRDRLTLRIVAANSLVAASQFTCADADTWSVGDFHWDPGCECGTTIDTWDEVSSFALSSAVVASAPANVVAPSLAGRARENQTLIGSEGVWLGADAGATTVGWERCTLAGACTSVGTSDAYRVTTSDIGNRLRFTVTTGNAYGSTSADLVTPPVTSDPSIDRVKPTAVALPTTVRAHAYPLLRFLAWDDRSKVSLTFTIRREGRTVLTVRRRGFSGHKGHTYTQPARMRMPKRNRSKVRFCVQARDASGNLSSTTCASLTFK